jgi:hypothetical protein
MQVEVPGGRGRPSIIVDKDEGLGKVNVFSFYFNTYMDFTNMFLSLSLCLSL